MRFDCHAHLFDLAKLGGDRAAPIPEGSFVIHSMHSREEWAWHESLYAGNPRVAASFGIHPQLPILDEADFLISLARTGKILAIGECGFDAFGEEYRATLYDQEKAFDLQVELALECSLPLIIHLRKAFDLLTARRKKLARLKGLVFHSWAFSPEEAVKLLDAGLNAYFSAGTPLLFKLFKGPNRAIRSLSSVPMDRILLETDAPYQPTRDRAITGLEDLGRVYDEAARIRGLSLGELETDIEANFRRVFHGIR